MCEIVFEDEKGEELEVEDILPYSLEADTIVLEDEDYGIWYLDIQEHPERYTGKTVVFRAQAMTSMEAAQGHLHPRPQRHDLLRRGHPLLRLPVQV